MISVQTGQECQREEVHSIILWLCRAQERGALALVLNGAQVMKAEVQGLEEIGGLRTRWKQLGTLRTTTSGRGLSRRFLVREVEQALTVPPIDLEEYCERLQIRNTINDYKRELNRSQLHFDVAVLQRDGELFICSGSEKVVALYSFSCEKNLNNAVLPVCLIVPRPWPKE